MKHSSVWRQHCRAAPWVIAFTLLGGGCATEPTPIAPPPRGEWAATTPVKAAVVEFHAHPWKTVVVGLSTRADVDRSFKPIQDGGKPSAIYRIDQIKATIDYDQSGKVVAIRVPSATPLSSGDLRSQFGAPDSSRQLDNGGSVLEYDRAGLTIEYAKGVEAPSSIAIRMPTRPSDETQSRLAATLLPVRPPLADRPQRIAVVEEALSESGKGINWVSPKSESKQALGVYAEFQSNGIIITAPDLQQYTNRLMDRLAAVVPSSTFEWNLIFIKGVLPNAMNTGGGYIFPTQGLLEQFDNEAELAFVIAHEMAHQLKGHVASAETRQQIATILIDIAEVATQAATGVHGVVSSAGALIAQASLAHFDQAQEADADRIGLEIMAQAGYDPRLALSTMERLKAVQEKYGKDFTIVSDHPPTAAREEAIHAWLEAHSGQNYANALTTTQEFIAIRSQYRLNPW